MVNKQQLEITVLGKSPAWQDTDSACSGYLLRTSEQNTLLDCGNGVLSKLQKHIKPAELDCVIISHLHADHFFDLVPLAYLLRFLPQPYGQPSRRPELYVPIGAGKAFEQIGSIWNMPDVLSASFELIEYAPGDSWALQDLAVNTVEVPHYVTTSAFSFTTKSDTKMVYGADCGPNNALIDLAEAAQLLIAEATLPTPQTERPVGHMCAAEAATLAEAANAEQLMLTHYSELFQDSALLEQAAANFTGKAILAKEELTLIV